MDIRFIQLLGSLIDDKPASAPPDFTDGVMRAVAFLPRVRPDPRRDTIFTRSLGNLSEKIQSLPVFFRAASLGAAALTAVAVLSAVAPWGGRYKRRVEFRVEMPGASRVSLVGDFNGWELPGIELSLDKNGKWVKNLRLPAGRYRYALMVDGKFMPDPSAREFVPDGFGAENAVLDTERLSWKM